jgi:hypothetical protein
MHYNRAAPPPGARLLVGNKSEIIIKCLLFEAVLSARDSFRKDAGRKLMEGE